MGPTKRLEVKNAWGKVVGTVEAYEKDRVLVSDASGKPVGTVEPDGEMRNAWGKVVGTVEATDNIQLMGSAALLHFKRQLS